MAYEVLRWDKLLQCLSFSLSHFLSLAHSAFLSFSFPLFCNGNQRVIPEKDVDNFQLFVWNVEFQRGCREKLLRLCSWWWRLSNRHRPDSPPPPISISSLCGMRSQQSSSQLTCHVVLSSLWILRLSEPLFCPLWCTEWAHCMEGKEREKRKGEGWGGRRREWERERSASIYSISPPLASSVINSWAQNSDFLLH